MLFHSTINVEFRVLPFKSTTYDWRVRSEQCVHQCLTSADFVLERLTVCFLNPKTECRPISEEVYGLKIQINSVRNEIDGQFSPLIIWMSLFLNIPIHVFILTFLLFFWFNLALFAHLSLFQSKTFCDNLSVLFKHHFAISSHVYICEPNKSALMCPILKQRTRSRIRSSPGVDSHLTPMNISVQHSGLSPKQEYISFITDNGCVKLSGD